MERWSLDRQPGIGAAGYPGRGADWRAALVRCPLVSGRDRRAANWPGWAQLMAAAPAWWAEAVPGARAGELVRARAGWDQAVYRPWRFRARRARAGRCF